MLDRNQHGCDQTGDLLQDQTNVDWNKLLKVVEDAVVTQLTPQQKGFATGFICSQMCPHCARIKGSAFDNSHIGEK